jgi:hypothetical protein
MLLLLVTLLFVVDPPGFNRRSAKLQRMLRNHANGHPTCPRDAIKKLYFGCFIHSVLLSNLSLRYSQLSCMLFLEPRNDVDLDFVATEYSRKMPLRSSMSLLASCQVPTNIHSLLFVESCFVCNL